MSAVIAAGIVPAALEMMDRKMTRAVENWLHAGLPTEAAAILLAEVTGEPENVEVEQEIILHIAAENGASEARIAADDAERALLWKARKSAFGAVAQTAPDYYLHDTVVPRTRLVETLREVYRIGEAHGLDMLNVFHAGDGNLHPLMAFDAAEPGGAGKGAGGGRRARRAVRPDGRGTHRRARRGPGETRPHAAHVHRGGPRRSGPDQGSLRPGRAVQPRQGPPRRLPLPRPRRPAGGVKGLRVLLFSGASHPGP